MIARVICICCLMIAVLPSAFAQASGPLVELSLIVTDRENKSIRELRKEERVLVFEDKIEQTILSVDVDERPVDLGIAIDASGSFRKMLAPALEIVQSIIATRRPHDQVFLERFIDTDKIQRVQDFTSDKNVLVQALRKMELVEGGQSAIIDAIYTAVNYVAEHNKDVPGRRKAVLIITDGEDRNSYYNVEKLINLLHEKRVQVFVLGFTAELEQTAGIRPGAREKAENLLKSIAKESGGRVFFTRGANELIDTTVQIAGDLTRQFRITYQSSNPEPLKKTFRTIEVKVDSEEKRKAIAPTGYYVQPKPSEKKSP
jgi:Ca-activated chloride channel homolog